MNQWFTKILTLVALSTSSIALPCGDYCGGGDYGGFYDVGGYNLFTFAIDVGTYVDYSYTDSYWGGGCATFSGCGGGYDLGLYSYNTGYSLGCDTLSAEIQLLSNQINAFTYSNALINSGQMPYVDTSCILFGTCGMGMNPGMGGFPNLSYGMPPGMDHGGTFYPGYPTQPPTFPPTNPPTFPPTTPPTFPPSFPAGQSFPGAPNAQSIPSSGFPTTQIPGTSFPTISGSSFPTSVPNTNAGNVSNIPNLPATLPPYGGCDNITVPCPTGPITRTDDLRRPPVYQPVTTESGNDPVRYRVPRGVVTHR